MGDDKKKATLLEQIAKQASPDNKRRMSMLRGHAKAADDAHGVFKKIDGYDSHRGVGLKKSDIIDHLSDFLKTYHNSYLGITEDSSLPHVKDHWKKKLKEAMQLIVNDKGNRYQREDEIYAAIQDEGLHVFTELYKPIIRSHDKAHLDQLLVEEILGDDPEKKKQLADELINYNHLSEEKRVEIEANPTYHGTMHLLEEREKLLGLHKSYTPKTKK